MFADYVVDQEARGIGKHQAAEAVDDHEAQAQRQEFSARQDHFTQVRPDFLDAFGLGAFGSAGFFARMLAGGRSFDGVGVHCNFSVA